MNSKKIVIKKRLIDGDSSRSFLEMALSSPQSPVKGRKTLNFKKKYIENKKLHPDTKKDSENKKAETYVFIDASYYIFYRYCATKVWFVKHTEMGSEEDCQVDNPLFLSKYVKHFQDGIKKIMKKFRPDGVVYFRDSPKSTVWRMDHLDSYKERRDKPSEPYVGQFFRYAYENLIPNDQLVSVSRAEGDDAIAIATKYENKKNPNRKIVIITGDSDFLQLSNDQTKIIKLPKLEEIPIVIKLTGKKIPVDGETYIQHKILIGDKSDDIPKVYHGCGPKIALDMVNNPDLLKQHILVHPERNERYKLNKKLIHFDEIPRFLKEKIQYEYKNVVNSPTIRQI